MKVFTAWMDYEIASTSPQVIFSTHSFIRIKSEYTRIHARETCQAAREWTQTFPSILCTEWLEIYFSACVFLYEFSQDRTCPYCYVIIYTPPIVCSGSVVVTAYDFESGRPGSNPERGLIYYKAPITAQGLPEPSSLWGSTLGTRAAEHKGCNWGMQIDWWLQLRAVFGHTFSGIIWHMPQK